MKQYILFSLFFLTGVSLFAQRQLQLDSISNYSYNSRTNDVWGYVDSNGTEYALVGRADGFSVISLLNPAAPIEVFTDTSVYSIWRDIKVWKNVAYVSNETDNGIAMYDLSTLPDSVSSVRYYTGDNYPIRSAHNLFIDEHGVLFAFGTDGPSGSFQTIMYDVDTDSLNPKELGYFDDNYLHDGYVRDDTLYGSAVYKGELQIIDVSDKSSPKLVNAFTTPHNFTHNAWLSDDSKTIFTTDEVSGAFVTAYDISNRMQAVELDRMQSRVLPTGVIPHNVHVFNDFLITSYYTLGISIVDANRPENMVEIGYFDTSPNYSGFDFHGNWGAYPYLPSGLILVTDIEEGLFVFQPHYNRASYLEGLVRNCQGNVLDSVKVNILEADGYKYTNIIGRFKTGTPFSGLHTVEFSKKGYETLVIDSFNFVPTEVNILNIFLQEIGEEFVAKVINTSSVNLSSVKVKLEQAEHKKTSSTGANGIASIVNFPFGNAKAYVGKWAYKNYCSPSIPYDCTNDTAIFVLEEGYEDDFSLDLGWQVTGNELSGKWERADAIGIVNGTQVASPSIDAWNDCNNKAYFTGSSNSTASNSDVDSTTILTSPSMNLKNYLEPYLVFYSWFYNAGADANDKMLLEIIDTLGNSIIIDTLDNNNHSNDWQLNNYKIVDYISPLAVSKVRFTVTDNSPEHVVEAGIDRFLISEGEFVGVNELFSEKEDLFKSFPNPFSEQIKLEFKTNEIRTVEVFDMQMNLLVLEILSEKEVYLNSSENWKAGVYLIKVTTRNGSTQTEKVLKY